MGAPEAGPPPPTPAYDVIGDVHGCHEELLELLQRLGYSRTSGASGGRYVPPPGRTAVFLGDLIDRGPRIPEVVDTVLSLVAEGAALCVLGNHEHQFLQHLAGDFPCAWGLEETMAQLAARPELRERLREFARGLPHQLALDDGRLVVVHAGSPEGLQGVDSPEARQFALYGNPTSTRRLDWAPDYRGAARVVYGHTPTDAPAWVNRTICIDTGCVYGGALTALRYPELELVAVPARRVWYAGA